MSEEQIRQFIIDAIPDNRFKGDEILQTVINQKTRVEQ